MLGQKDPKKDYFKRKQKGQIRKKKSKKIFFKKHVKKEKKGQEREKIKTLPKEKNKCPLFLILVHWIFVIIEYNIFGTLM